MWWVWGEGGGVTSYSVMTELGSLRGEDETGLCLLFIICMDGSVTKAL